MLDDSFSDLRLCPVRPLAPEEPADPRRDAIVGPCPSDDCEYRDRCAATGHECRAFKSFVSTGRWVADERG
jgi:hypothetical protein